MIQRLLVANRGEIARRIFRTCRRLGIETVAVYTEADARAPHVLEADAALPLGTPDGYLAPDRILDAARRSGADAIHPGYGFLAERPAFARAVEEAGLLFVGPPAGCMERLGDKAQAKRIAREAGVPVVPGWDGEAGDARELARRARKLGLPLLVKAAAGGGGKGMRLVAAWEELEEALLAARGEAERAFGDGRLLLERWIDRPRHIEVQIFGDHHGNIVHLFERDCTLQRRHQKIMEECPAFGIAEEIRERLWEAALRLARAVGYANAGTVEFLLAPDGNFYFIEANARLQVEHPVTEAVTGLDLVEWQLRIAAGERLPLLQDQIQARGFAVEVRLCAEAPEEGFRPATGRITELHLPEQLPGIRIDAGIEPGSTVTAHYDSLLAKIIAAADDRPGAHRRLLQALERTQLGGVRTNLGFLARLLAHPAVQAGRIDTGWLEREAPALAARDDRTALAPLAALALLAHRLERPTSPAGVEAQSPWNLRNGFRLGAPARQRFCWWGAEGEEVWHAEAEDGGWRITGGGRSLRAGWIRRDGTRVLFEVPGEGTRAFSAWLREEAAVTVACGSERATFVLDPGSRGGGEGAGGERILRAPLPGRIVAVPAEEGARVRRGTPVVVLEAMKMEQRLSAPFDGCIVEVRVRPGDQVEEGAVLAVLEPEA